MPYTNFQSRANPTEFRPHTCYILPSGHPKLITWSRSMRELFTFLCSEIGKYRLPTPCCSSCDLIHSRSEFLMMCFRLHYLFQMFCYPWKYTVVRVWLGLYITICSQHLLCVFWVFIWEVKIMNKQSFAIRMASTTPTPELSLFQVQIVIPLLVFRGVVKFVRVECC